MTRPDAPRLSVLLPVRNGLPWLQLALDGLPYMRVIVAVAGGPPAGDAVDQFAPVGECDARALRSHDR